MPLFSGAMKINDGNSVRAGYTTSNIIIWIFLVFRTSVILAQRGTVLNDSRSYAGSQARLCD